jgi:ribose transport system permease protein
MSGAPRLTTSRRRRFSWHEFNDRFGEYVGVGGVLLLLCVYLTITQENFATYDNLLNILQANAILLVVATGASFVLLSGMIDLSAGGALSLAGILLWYFGGRHGWPAPLALGAATLVVMALGLVLNGLLVGRLRMHFIVVTLGTGAAFGGAALLIADGESKSLYAKKSILTFGRGEIAGVPSTIIVALIILLCGIFVLRYTGFGRMIYAVGGNPEAARLAGINVSRIHVAVFAISAGTAGLAGLLQAGHLTTAAPTAGVGIELSAAAAALLGGVTFHGGRGTLLGTFLGAMFLGVLANGISLAGIPTYWQGVISGTVLVFAVGIDRLRLHTSGRRSGMRFASSGGSEIVADPQLDKVVPPSADAELSDEARADSVTTSPRA